MRGPKPTPTSLKIMRGNPGHRPLNAQEPQPQRVMPPCPEHLDSVARLEWERVAPEVFRLGLLTILDSMALAAYCQAVSRWAAAEEVIGNEGLTTTNPETGAVRAHPAVSIAKESMRLIREFCAEFGLTPAARVRVKVEQPKNSVPTRARA